MQAYAGFLSQILAIKWHPMTGNHELSYWVQLFQYFTLLTVLKEQSAFK